ncbi:hypothetical protein EJ08DRAFT_646869 [Tothia fuscella]|uniref:very-long-chain enoyl-CoA reductase n=1 Tax=Tothia fuscella TaxID=1048955 RepID=A0A9P4NZ93_9PEZI|nr:hypothetical protein EJ08DRAFT_646869 [Tothia fuscella]
MASKQVVLAIKPRGKPIKKLPKEATVTPSDTTAELYKQIAGSARFDINRLRITNDEDGKLVPNAKDVTIEAAGLENASTIRVKDLGPQIAWRTVFIVEYLGPLLIHPLFYFLRPYIYSSPGLVSNKMPPPSPLQTLSMVLIVLHFVKREYETVAVHRFSLSTMPVLNIFKNSAHYWALAGFNIAYWTYAPTSWAQGVKTIDIMEDKATALGLLLFILGEIGNFYTHIVLRDLRAPGSTERGIPQGFGFDIVTCPNYFFEIVAWAGIFLVTRSLSTWVFIMVAGTQMILWAQKKEKKYREEFGSKYMAKKFAVVPWFM